MSIGLRSPWPLALAAATAALLAVLVGTLMALLGAQLACMGGGGSAGPAPSRSARGEIPAARLRIYQAAGRRFDIDWAFLASIGTQECGNAGTCAGVNASGCAGPMQIAYVRQSPCSPGAEPTLWERFSVDGNGDGTKDVNDPADAIFTAARILRDDLGAPRAGGSYAAYRQAACRYYGACADPAANYADEVMARAVRYGFDGHGTTVTEQQQSTASQGPVCQGAAIGGGSGSAIVRIAERQLGRGEQPPGSNCTPYGLCEEWCALFVAWVWEHARVPMRGGTAPYAYSGSIYEWAKAHGGRILPPGATPSPGDAVLFGWGPSASEHVAIVERVFGNEITTIDGNYANRVARVGPYPSSLAVVGGEPAPIYAYAQPPVGGPAEGGVGG